MALKSWTVRLRKTGTPTGNVTATVRDGTDTVLATFTETPAGTSLGTSFADVTFTLATPQTLANNDRILIEYAGATSVEIEILNTDRFDGVLTRRTSFNVGTGVYSDSSTSDVCGSMDIVDNGQVGVRVPAGGAFPRVMYQYPYSVSNRTGASLNVNAYEGTSASLVLTESSYYGDFDVTFSVRTISQKRVTPATANSWEVAWFMWHFNESEGEDFHHYYLALKSNGGIELGRKDNAVAAEEQYFLNTAGTFSYVAGTWYKVRVRVVSNAITVWVDDVQKIDMVDNGSLESSRWMLQTHQQYQVHSCIQESSDSITKMQK